MPIQITTSAAKGGPLTAVEADANMLALSGAVQVANAAVDAANAAIADANAQIDTNLAAANALINNIQSQITNGLADVNNSTTQLRNQLTTLSTHLDNSFSGFTSMQQALTTETEARTTQYTNLAATVAGNTSSINNINQTLSTTTSSQSTAITQLQSTVAGHTATLTSISQTVATLESASSSITGSITSRLGTAEGKITTLQGTVATNQSATSTAITNLTSSLGATQSGLTSLQQTVATANSATSTSITNLTSSLGSTQSALTALQSTVATANSSTATSLTNLSTTLAGHTASISTLQSSIDGMTASWGVSINNNGRVTGLLLSSGADSKSTFSVMADKFEIVDPSNGAHTPFTVSNGTVYMDNVRSSNYAAPTSSAPPTGYKLQSIPFPTTFLDGTTANVDFELGSNANFNGYNVGGLTMSRLVQGGTVTVTNGQTKDWVCPAGVTFATVTVVGAGGGSTLGAGGGSGAVVKFNVTLVPGQTYHLVSGAGGTGLGTTTPTSTTHQYTYSNYDSEGNYLGEVTMNVTDTGIYAGEGGSSSAFGFIATGGYAGITLMSEVTPTLPTVGQQRTISCTGGRGGNAYYQGHQISERSTTGGEGVWGFVWSNVAPRGTYSTNLRQYNNGWRTIGTISGNDTVGNPGDIEPLYGTGASNTAGNASDPSLGVLWTSAISGASGGAQGYNWPICQLYTTHFPVGVSLGTWNATTTVFDVIDPDTGDVVVPGYSTTGTTNILPLDMSTLTVLTMTAGTCPGFGNSAFVGTYPNWKLTWYGTKNGASSGIAEGPQTSSDPLGYGVGGVGGGNGGPGCVIVQY